MILVRFPESQFSQVWEIPHYHHQKCKLFKRMLSLELVKLRKIFGRGTNMDSTGFYPHFYLYSKWKLIWMSQVCKSLKKSMHLWLKRPHLKRHHGWEGREWASPSLQISAHLFTAVQFGA